MKRWTIERYDTDVARNLAKSEHISELLAFLLVRRGIKTPQEVQSFLRPSMKEQLHSPSLLPGCIETAERLLQAVKDKRKITIYGDYDVDGITGISILYKMLQSLGGTIGYYVPCRLEEDYGLNSEVIKKLAAEGTQVLITVDCGITSVQEAETAKQAGIELLITDHHMPDSVLPDAFVLCHAALPGKDGKSYPFPYLCGAAVGLKVAWATAQLAENGIDQPVSPRLREQLTEMLALAALGTVADFVPLRGENRALVSGGLKFLVPDKVSPGLKSLLELILAKKKGSNKTLTADDIAFQIAPRINAACRLGQAGLAVELLLSNDPVRTEQLAADLNHFNDERKRLEREICREAEKQIVTEGYTEAPALVLAGDWHRGVVGIVAGRLAEKYHRPVILFAKDKMKLKAAVGSARSIAGFDLLDAVQSCQEHLIRCGGHTGAAGLSIEDNKIPAFREAFCRTVGERIPPENRLAELSVDGIFPLSAFHWQTAKEIQQLEPFGSENPSPVFAVEGVYVQNVRLAGPEQSIFTAEFYQKTGSGQSAVIKGFSYHRGDWAEAMRPYNVPMDIAFKVKISSYSGKVELEILDWRRQEA